MVSKVKGHATIKDVEQGKTIATHRSCNNVADGLVREATALHGKDIADLVYWLEARHKAYTNVMIEVQTNSICLIIADKEERDRKKTEANPFTRTYIIKI